MSAQTLLQYVTWALFAVVFAATLVQAIRHPRRSTVDPALLFGACGLIIALAAIGAAVGAPPNRPLNTVEGGLIIALPFLLVRLAQDFARLTAALVRAAEVGLIAAVALLAFLPRRPLAVDLLLVAYFVLVTAYATAVFAREAALAGGITRRRLVAVAAGSGCLALDISLAGLALIYPRWGDLWQILTVFSGLASGVGYFIGFAPPRWLKRAWTAPELHAFLASAASLPRLPDTQGILRELERGVATSLGANEARIGLWDEHRQALLYHPRHVPLQLQPAGGPEDALVAFSPEGLVAGEALRSQQPVFVPRPAELRLGERFVSTATRNLLAAPITAGDRRLGALTVHARSTIFAENDLELLSLLANQVAIILESRKLIDAATRVQAREEAARLKDDFLSAAAHDLKSPLTSVLGQAQRLQRQAHRDHGRVDPRGLDVIVEQTRRLSTLVNELLDAARVEGRALSGIREQADLTDVLRDVCSRELSHAHRCQLDFQGPLVGTFDIMRMRQLFENLVENAVKYSPEGGDIAVRAWREDGTANVTVCDHGIGVNPEELPHIFERFHRGGNVDDRRFPGMGLGLYICRGIVEEHGGRIWATSVPGEGTTIHVTIPLGEREKPE
jgi:signal transduction histidine kinase